MEFPDDHIDLEIVMGGGGALYPYFAAWTQSLVDKLTPDQIDRLYFTTHSVSTMVPLLLWIWKYTGKTPHDTFWEMRDELKKRFDESILGPWLWMYDHWRQVIEPHIRGLPMEWINSHLSMNCLSLNKMGRVVYNHWTDTDDFMNCCSSSGHLPFLSWKPFTTYKDDVVVDGAFLDDYHRSLPNKPHVEILASTYRDFDWLRRMDMDEFDDHKKLYKMGKTDFNHFIKTKILPGLNKKSRIQKKK